MDRAQELHQGAEGQGIPARIGFLHCIHHRDHHRDQRDRFRHRLYADQGDQGLHAVPLGVLYAEPDRRHYLGLHLAAAAERRAGPLGPRLDL